MHARCHLDYFDFIYYIPELREESGNESDEYYDDISDANLENDCDVNYISGLRLNFQIPSKLSGYWCLKGIKYPENIR